MVHFKELTAKYLPFFNEEEPAKNFTGIPEDQPEPHFFCFLCLTTFLFEDLINGKTCPRCGQDFFLKPWYDEGESEKNIFPMLPQVSLYERINPLKFVYKYLSRGH